MKKPSASVDEHLAHNQDFVRLIQVAREDPAIRRQLISFLTLDDFNRQSALNTWLHQLRLNGAPLKFTRAIACLTDPVIAHKALGLIQGHHASLTK
ncbi:MAG: hypothetical protein JEZ11_05735 [Desulfobacterales bacterium]|nr:hypothetical protein [Desulfobacterales bacterium]